TRAAAAARSSPWLTLQLPFPALKLIIHPAPERARTAGTDGLAIERRHGLNFARRGGDPDFVRAAQLRFADGDGAAGQSGACCQFLHHPARRAWKDLSR